MQPQFDDQEVMRRIVARDQQAFRSFYQHYGTAVYSLAYRILQNSTLAEEVTQDTFVKVWNQKSSWDPDKGSLKTWLLTISHYTAIDRIRSERRQPNLHPEPIEDIEDQMPAIREVTGWQDGIVLQALMKQLPEEQAFLIDLAFFHGLTHSEIAEETRIPLGTVKTRLRSGLQKLRELWLESVKQTSANP